MNETQKATIDKLDQMKAAIEMLEAGEIMQLNVVHDSHPIGPNFSRLWKYRNLVILAYRTGRHGNNETKEQLVEQFLHCNAQIKLLLGL